MKGSLLFFALFCIAAFSAVTCAQDRQADKTAIKAHFEKFSAAWNKADGKAMAATYTEDGCLIDPFGTEARGRQAVDSLLTVTVTTFLKGTTTSFATDYIRFLKPDVAFVDATQIVTGARSPEGQPLPEMKFHLILSMIKKDGRWWYVDARPYQFMAPPETISEK